MAKLIPPMRRISLGYALPLLLALALRILLDPDSPAREPLWFALCLASGASVLASSWPISTKHRHLRWQAGAMFLLAINLGYQAVGRFLHNATSWRADDWLNQIDHTLLAGHSPQTLLAPLQSPWFSNVLALCYAFFLILLPIVSLYYTFAAAPRPLLGYWRGLMLVYGLGFAGYLLLPAAGPYLHHSALLPTISHGGISRGLHQLIAGQSTSVDVWPSLHAAVTLYILLWFRTVNHNFYCWLLLPCILLFVSTLYLQYHYLIDLLCGFALAFAANYFAHKELTHNDGPIAA